MKVAINLILGVAVIVALAPVPAMAQEAAEKAAEAAQPAAKASDMDDDAKMGYSFGVRMGQNIQRMPVSIDMEAFLRGMQDVLDKKPLALTEEEMTQVAQEFQKKAVARQQEEHKKLIEENQAEEQAYLDENGKKEGVVTLDSGIQYAIMTEGTGKTPLATDRVKVHYRGTFADGTEFGNSYKRNAPAEFLVNKGMIPGWTEVLQLMKEGAKWNVVLPAKWAYGNQGRRGMGGGWGIPPGKMLLFEIELLEILPSVTVAPSSQQVEIVDPKP